MQPITMMYMRALFVLSHTKHRARGNRAIHKKNPAILKMNRGDNKNDYSLHPGGKVLKHSQLIFSGSGVINANLPARLYWLNKPYSEKATIFSVSNHLRRIRQKYTTLENSAQSNHVLR